MLTSMKLNRKSTTSTFNRRSVAFTGWPLACRCEADKHDIVKPCSAASPPLCDRVVAEACAAGPHIVRRACHQRQARCNMQLLGRCQRGHPVVLSCSDTPRGEDGEGAGSAAPQQALECWICAVEDEHEKARRQHEADMAEFVLRLAYPWMRVTIRVLMLPALLSLACCAPCLTLQHAHDDVLKVNSNKAIRRVCGVWTDCMHSTPGKEVCSKLRHGMAEFLQRRHAT